MYNLNTKIRLNFLKIWIFLGNKCIFANFLLLQNFRLMQPKLGHVFQFHSLIHSFLSHCCRCYCFPNWILFGICRIECVIIHLHYTRVSFFCSLFLSRKHCINENDIEIQLNFFFVFNVPFYSHLYLVCTFFFTFSFSREM